MMDLYHSMIVFTISVTWIITTLFILGLWAIWGVEEIESANVPDSLKLNQSIGDMCFITASCVLIGGFGGLLGATIWPITLPVLILVTTVYSLKLYHIIAE